MATNFADATAPAEAIESSFGEHDCVVFAAFHFAETGVHVATQIAHVEIWARVGIMRLDKVSPHHLAPIAKLLKDPDMRVRINAARAQGGRVVAIGTTSLRLLESAAAENGEIREFAGETRLFILPGYRFRAIDLLLTNFHLPRSTLLMLVAALAGLERIKSAYAHAVAERYRFFSYGDACLIERDRKVAAP